MITSKFFKILWSINAILIFVLFTIALVTLIREEYPLIFKGSTKKHDRGIIVGKNAEIAKELKVNLQHLMYDSPEKIKGSDFYLMEIVVIDKELPKSVKDAIKTASDVSVYLIGAAVNIVFFNEKRTKVYKLLDSYGYIKSYNFPRKKRGYYDSEDDSERDYILYEMAFRDTNKDGRINENDSTAFYISDLEGKNLKQITPFRFDFDKYSFSEDGTEIYFEILKKYKDRDVLGHPLKSRELFYYNFKTNKFGEFEELDKILSSVQDQFTI